MKPHHSRLYAIALAAALLPACAASPTHESTGQYLDDAAITTKVKSQLLTASGIHSTGMSVETDHGVVHLTGTARSDDERERAAQVARGVSGVRRVDNELQVR